MKHIYRFSRITEELDEMALVEDVNEDAAWAAAQTVLSAPRGEYEVQVLGDRPVLWNQLTIF